MPIWKTPGVDEQPSITVVRWRVLEVADGACKGQRHIVAYCPENYEGRVSTNIVAFDEKKRTCITRTGRTYCLHGPPGFDADGEFVWQMWTRGSVDSIDISQEFVKAEMES